MIERYEEYSKRELEMYNPYGPDRLFCDDDENDEYAVNYTGTDGQEWTVYLTRSEYEHAMTLEGAERIRYLESFE